MPPETRKLLNDLLVAGDAILSHAGDLTPSQYQDDILVRSLVERQCEIIGEALRRLERIDPSAFSRIAHARRIIDFRNVIAHGYDSLDPVIVSQVVREHLPLLVEDARTVLAGS